MKVVVNRDFGGFKIPEKLVNKLGWYCVYFSTPYRDGTIDERTDPELIKALEDMLADGEKIWPLEIVEIPDDVDWYIHNYDGKETIHERHRIW